MFGGAGSGPMLAAAAAWDGLAGELGSAAASFGSVTSALVGASWQGPASVAMAGAAAPYIGWLHAAANRAAGSAAQAQAVVSAFEAAQAATVHPLAVAANRSDLVSFVRLNVFGQNAPAIAAAEAEYEQMWAQDVAAMSGYHAGASTAAAQLSSWQGSLQSVPGQLASAFTGNVLPGNTGNSNVGGGNTGNGNWGSGNVGNANVGGGNSGDDNLGS